MMMHKVVVVRVNRSQEMIDPKTTTPHPPHHTYLKPISIYSKKTKTMTLATHSSSKHKRQLFEKINNLSSTEHEEIFNIINRHDDITYTSNKNGVFFNLSNITDDVIEEIDNFVNFCLSNKKDLDEYDQKLNECKANASIININLSNIVEIKPSKPSHSFANPKLSSALPINNDITVTSIEHTLEPKNVQKFVNYIEKLYADKCTKKKMNVKFHNAKKKYSKKVVQESKIEFDFLGDLYPEEYIFKA